MQMKTLVLPAVNSGYDSIIEFLEAMDHEVVTAGATRIAIKAIEDDPDIDLVIADAAASGGTGIDLLRHVKQNASTRWIPVIMTAAKWNQSQICSCLTSGAVDILSLPVAEETFKAKVNLALANGKRVILVVDDEPLIVDLLKDKLELERCKVLTANSAEEALRILESNTVHLVVSDIVMPGESGMYILIEVKRQYSDIPVVLITGYSGKYTPDDAIAAGADGYFKKPFNNIEIMYTIRRILNSRHQPVRKLPTLCE